jgi:hypothetical protein
MTPSIVLHGLARDANEGISCVNSPGQWDVSYYQETYSYATTGSKSNAVFVFPSDSRLSTYDDVGKKFQDFIGNQGKWTSSFASA